MRNPFARILLARWKGAHYIYRADTRLFYRRLLLQLITENGKLHDWPAFIKAIHIDAAGVNNRKDNPRIWFEYKQGFEFITETESGKKAAVTVHSFSPNTAPSQTPTPKRRQQSDQPTTDGKRWVKSNLTNLGSQNKAKVSRTQTDRVNMKGPASPGHYTPPQQRTVGTMKKV